MSSVTAQYDQWYWDAESQMYYAGDEYGVIYMYEPYGDVLFAYNSTDGSYYYYEPAYEEFIYIGYVDAYGNYIEEGGDYYADEGGSSSKYDEAMNGLMMQNHIDCMNTINNSMGDFGYFYSY
ncbi:MAG: hypothetical protein GF403_09310 [Candidatus Coatesbacteria bacterium]|nr:hypothetical protein [Candidatus Coatesbacteria bacterium]